MTQNIYELNGERLVQLCMERKASFRQNHEILVDVYNLLKIGANPNYFYPDMIGDEGTTPLSAAMYSCFIDCMILLKHFGAKFGKTEYSVLENLASDSTYLYKVFPELVANRPAGSLFESYALDPDRNMPTGEWHDYKKNILEHPYLEEIRKILETGLKNIN